MRTKIKICGLRREEDIAYVNKYKPDYVGFVFADSKRKVTAEQAGHLKALLHPGILAVGVFVNEDPDKVVRLVQDGIIDVVQLHGDETEAYMIQLRKRLESVTIIKAVRVASDEDVKDCERIPADYLLFDTFSRKGYGGTGDTFDWELVKGIRKPFFLAGGINSGNVQDALSIGNVYGVDVSSAVETDGYKDESKIKEFICRVRDTGAMYPTV